MVAVAGVKGKNGKFMVKVACWKLVQLLTEAVGVMVYGMVALKLGETKL